MYDAGGYSYDNTGNTWGTISDYRARYYDPQTGRFLSEDPIGFRGGINKYSYVRNRPINAIDPRGLANESGPGPLRPNYTDANGQTYYCDYGICVKYDGKSGPNLRLPDYYQCQCSLGLKCTKDSAGSGFSLEIDRYGHVYSAGGGGGGWSAKKLSCSCTMNWLGAAIGPAPDEQTLANFLTGGSYSVVGGYSGVVIQYSWNSSNQSPGIGVGTAQLGGSWGYGVELRPTGTTPGTAHEHWGNTSYQ